MTSSLTWLCVSVAMPAKTRLKTKMNRHNLINILANDDSLNILVFSIEKVKWYVYENQGLL
jgi:hypothetical protein